MLGAGAPMNILDNLPFSRLLRTAPGVGLEQRFTGDRYGTTQLNSNAGWRRMVSSSRPIGHQRVFLSFQLPSIVGNAPIRSKHSMCSIVQHPECTGSLRIGSLSWSYRRRRSAVIADFKQSPHSLATLLLIIIIIHSRKANMGNN